MLNVVEPGPVLQCKTLAFLFLVFPRSLIAAVPSLRPPSVQVLNHMAPIMMPPSAFELGFVALRLTWHWETPDGRVCEDPNLVSTWEPGSYARVHIHPTTPHHDDDRPAAMWKSYDDAQTSLTSLLVHEAAARTNENLEKLRIVDHKCGGAAEDYDFGVAPGVVFRKSVRLICSSEDVDFFRVEGEVIEEQALLQNCDGISPPRKRVRYHRSDEWTRGDVCILSICEVELRRERLRTFVHDGSAATSPILWVDERLEKIQHLQGTAPTILHGVVDANRTIVLALQKGSWLADALNCCSHPLPAHALPILRLRSGSVHDLVRHARALQTMKDSCYADYVADPRFTWQTGIDLTLRDWKIGSLWDGSPDPVHERMTDEQSLVPTMLQSRVVMRAFHRGGGKRKVVVGRGEEDALKRPFFMCVQGPPGSGKTTTIVSVLNKSFGLYVQRLRGVHARMDVSTTSDLIFRAGCPRFLVAAPTNHATDEILFRVRNDPTFGRLVAALSSGGKTNVERAVLKFMETCALVRLGQNSTDKRKEVMATLQDALVDRVENIPVEALSSVDAQIAKLNAREQRVDATCDLYEGLVKKLDSSDPSEGYSENSRPRARGLVEVDSIPCILEGDITVGLARSRRILEALASERSRIANSIANLETEKTTIANLFHFYNGCVEGGHVRNMIFANAVCVFCTCDGAANLSERYPSGKSRESTLHGTGFDLVLVDEAARCTIPQLLVPVAVAQHLQREGMDCTFDVLAVGDPAQISATLSTGEPAVSKLLSYSFLARALDVLDRQEQDAKQRGRTLWPPPYIQVLNRQFRMHPEISFFPSRRFYSSRLLDGLPAGHFECPWYFTERSREGKSVLSGGAGLGPLLFVGTNLEAETGESPSMLFQPTQFEYTRIYSNSRGNLGEALLLVKVLNVLRKLLIRHHSGVFHSAHPGRRAKVLIIAPYKLQEDLLKEMLMVSSRASPSDPAATRPKAWKWEHLWPNHSKEDFDNLILPTLGEGMKREKFHSGKNGFNYLAEMRFDIPFLHTFFEITVSTVDSSIGREVDVVLLTQVSEGDSAFLVEDKRLCVALTRASSLLVVCGPIAATFNDSARSSDSWNSFAAHCDGKGLLVSAVKALNYLDTLNNT